MMTESFLEDNYNFSESLNDSEPQIFYNESQNISKDLCSVNYELEDILLFQRSSWWLEGVCQSVLCVVGIITNTFSVIILLRKEMCNTFNQLLISLAVVDVLYMSCMLIFSLGTIFKFSFHMVLVPHLLHPLRSISLTASVFMVISVAVERYIAVYYPFSRLPSSVEGFSSARRKRLVFHLSPVVTLSVLLNITKFLESEPVYDSARGEYTLKITEFRTNILYNDIQAWSRFFIMGILPLGVVSVLNFRIYSAVRKARIARRQMTYEMIGVGDKRRNVRRNLHKEPNDEHLSIMLVAIILVFVLCNISRCILTMYEVIILDMLRICIKEKRSLGHGYPMWNIVLGNINHVLLVLNPSLNFIIYCAIGKRFRLAAKQFFGGQCSCCRDEEVVVMDEPLGDASRRYSFRDSITTFIRGSFRSSRGSVLRGSIRETAIRE